jgi:hypothetical protein
MTRTAAGDTGVMELVAAHRRQLATVLSGLDVAEWDQPSLCGGWRVRHVVAHMIMPFRYPAPRFLAELARSRGNFDKMADRVARRDGAGALTHDVIHASGVPLSAPAQELALVLCGRKLPAGRLAGPASSRFSRCA